jgi:ATP-dependent DNA ligase
LSGLLTLVIRLRATWTAQQMPSDVHPDRIGSLVLAAYDVAAKEAAQISRRPRLLHAGRVGTGFSHRILELLQQALLPLQIERNQLDEGGPPSARALCVRKWYAR